MSPRLFAAGVLVAGLLLIALRDIHGPSLLVAAVVSATVDRRRPA